jgi:hypothetical protein
MTQIIVTIRRWCRTLGRRFGYRGAFLLLLGIYDIFFGIFLVRGALIGHELYIPEKWWGVIWIVIGIALLAGSLIKHNQLFFALAVRIKMTWALEYFNPKDAGTQWTRGVYTLALAGIVVLIASWPEAR